MNNFRITDPTYLRTIFDGLLSGAVHKDNASALPQGLVGMYEEALPPAVNVNERKKFLDFFAVCALFKKEVSAGFVLPLLEGWAEAEVLEYIAQYSNWFNSPTGGTYVLYHERLRAFVLQKISHGQFKACNEAIMRQCRVALQAKSGDVWERYALEHLSSHLLIQAMESKDATALKALAYDTSHWNRQVEISKGFEWSKRMLNDMILWASKYDDDEVIECALNKVDLHHFEQNDAPRIMEIVAKNDIETALQRIEAFGGNDKEGLQRKFILYMLCLMELTLLDSKDKPFRKEAIEKLLKHLDDNLPVDHSVLNWNDFFPSYLMFLMACEWAELGFDYLMVLKRTNTWNFDWVVAKGPYSVLQFEILLKCVDSDEDYINRINSLNDVYSAMIEQRQLEKAASVTLEALALAKEVNDDINKCRALVYMFGELAKQGLKIQADSVKGEVLELAVSIESEFDRFSVLKDLFVKLAVQGHTDEAYSYACGIDDIYWRSITLSEISREWRAQGLSDRAAFALQEANSLALIVEDDYFRSNALQDISKELAALGRMEEALACIQNLEDDSRDIALSGIALEFSKKGNIEEVLDLADGIADDLRRCILFRQIAGELYEQEQRGAAYVMIQKSLVCVRGISDEWSDRTSQLKMISIELARQGKMDEGLDCARAISDESEKGRALNAISVEMAKHGMFQESIECATNIDYESERVRSIIAISNRVYKLGKLEVAEFAVQQAFLCAIEMRDGEDRSIALKSICYELVSQGKIIESTKVFLKLVGLISGPKNESEKFISLIYISRELAKQGMLSEAFACYRMIPSIYWPWGIHPMKDQCVKLAVQGHTDEAYSYACGIDDIYWRSITLSEISREWRAQGLSDRAAFALQEANSLALIVEDDYFRSNALQDISKELAALGRMEEALACIQNLEDDSRDIALSGIALEFSKKGNIEEVLDLADGIADDLRRCILFRQIAGELYEQEQRGAAYVMIQKSLVCVRGISDEWSDRTSQLKMISIELARQGKMDEGLDCARAISDESEKGRALNAISVEMAKHGMFQESIECALNIEYESEKNRALSSISALMANHSMIESAKETVELIDDYDWKFRSLLAISNELRVKQRLEDSLSIMKEVIECARILQSQYDRDNALADIALQLTYSSRVSQAEAVAQDILQIDARHTCWINIAKSVFEQQGWAGALRFFNEFKDQEARLFFLKGWSEQMDIQYVTKECVSDVLPYIAGDGEGIEELMQKHALHELFFGEVSEDRIVHLNRTLNIQWAIDIKNSFSAN